MSFYYTQENEMDEIEHKEVRELIMYFMDKDIDVSDAIKIMAKATHCLICLVADEQFNDEEYEDESN